MNKKICKSFCAVILVLVLVVCILPTRVVASDTMKGNGSYSNPYQIDTYAKLKEFAAIVNRGAGSACAILLCDIDATGQNDWTPIGNGTNKYSDIFNGNGKVINGLSYTDTNSDYVGLFGYVNHGTIKDVGIENASFHAHDYVGAVAGCLENGDIINCYNTGAIQGHNYVGGIAGENNDYGNIECCYNTGTIQGYSDVGGIAGDNLGSISNCYNRGVVSSYGDAGGVTAMHIGKIIQNCYSAGTVSGNLGLVGSLIELVELNAVVKNSCCDIDLTIGADAILGNNGTASNVRGLHTSEMTGLDTTAYDSWEDFDTYWILTESYPVLKNNHPHSITSVSASEPTCETDGNIAYWKCRVCGACFSDANGTTEISQSSVMVPATGHRYGAWTKLDDTKHKRVCSKDSSHVEIENHSWNSGTVTKKATTDASGIKTYTCTVCHATKTESIPKLEKQEETETETETENNNNKKKVSVKDEPIVSYAVSKGKKSLTFGWTKVEGAQGYDIFLATCNHDGKKSVLKKVKTIKKNKTFVWTKSGLKKGTSYEVCFKAYVMKNGKKKYIKTSPIIHAYTNGGNDKYTNAKSVTVNKKKVTLKKGKTFTIKAKVNKLDKKKKPMPASHVATLRYYSSDKSIATVNSKGKVTGKAKGVCYIDVIAHNGVSAQVKVTIK